MRTVLILAACLLRTGVASAQAPAQHPTYWVTLLDGTTLDGWNTLGDANWKVVDGTIEATSGSGLLVTPVSYSNFELIVEVWVDATANSGIHIRCSNPATINQSTAYEVNIYDTRPDPTYATGAIVEVAPPIVPMMAGGKWNTFQIRAEGNHLMVIMNGTKTVDVRNDKYASGPIGLQHGAGVVKFRNVQIRTL